IGEDGRAIVAHLKLADEGAVLVVREMEGLVVDPMEAVLLENLPQPLLAVQIGPGIALLAAKLLGPFDERNEQAHRAVALQDDRALELGESGEPAHTHRRGWLAIDVEHEVACAVVVAVELLPVWALLLAHEYGGPQRVAL